MTCLPASTSRAQRWVAALALAVALGGCSQAPVQVEGVKLAAAPSSTASRTPSTPAHPSLAPAPGGRLAVRLLPVATAATAGRPVTLTVQYADAHGGLVGTVEDFGDGGLGGLKISDCRLSERNPSTGSKTLTHTFAKAGTYRVSVTVTTLSCVYGQEDVTARATVTVR